eukprot:Filipodium_phascolosomae@DN1308_c0_g1_i2.p1
MPSTVLPVDFFHKTPQRGGPMREESSVVEERVNLLRLAAESTAAIPLQNMDPDVRPLSPEELLYMEVKGRLMDETPLHIPEIPAHMHRVVPPYEEGMKLELGAAGREIVCHLLRRHGALVICGTL